MRMTITLAALLLALTAPLAQADPSAKEIVGKMLDQPSPAHAVAVVKMTLSGGTGGVRQLTSYIRKDNGRTRSVVKFQEPADYRGAGILVLEKEGGEMDRFLRLNGQKRVRRLPAGSNKGSFLGTDFSYEDLDGRTGIRNDKHSMLREEVFGGQPCWVIETTPREESGSAWKRIVQWIRKDNYVPIQMEFYDDGDKPAKRLVVDEMKNVDGFWISTRSRMSTVEKGTSTQLEVLKTDFKTDIADSTFTERFLLE